MAQDLTSKSVHFEVLIILLPVVNAKELEWELRNNESLSKIVPEAKSNVHKQPFLKIFLGVKEHITNAQQHLRHLYGFPKNKKMKETG